MDDKLLEQVDQLLAPYFKTLGDKVSAIKTEVKVDAPQVQVTVPPIVVPEIKVPPISIPEIKVPTVLVPPIHVPKPEVTVNVDEVRVKNWPVQPTPERFDDTAILKALKAILMKPTGGGGGPTEYASGDAYVTNQLFGNVPLWDDGGTLRAISASKPLPVDLSSSDIVDVSALATEATLASIKDTAGIKKITDALPAGTNILGKVRIYNSDDTDNSLSAGGQIFQKVGIMADGDKYVRGNVAEGSPVSDPVYIGGRDASGNVYGIRTGQQTAANSLPVILPSATITTLTPPTTVTVQQSTATSLKAQAEMYQGGTAVSTSNPAAVKQVVLPLATNVSSTLTLTSASTAYQITEPTSDFLVTYCNASDTDMYWGFATLTSGGILLAKSGGTVTLLCSANNSPFFYCASAGKVLNYTTTVI